jgi:hypothetical protein
MTWMSGFQKSSFFLKAFEFDSEDEMKEAFKIRMMGLCS